MRIPSAASTASLAPQSSALTMPVGDSFMVIFAAASAMPASGSPLTRSATKEEAENGTASQPESEQVDAQASSIQTSNASASATVSAPFQSESVAAPKSKGQDNTNRPTIQSSSITAGQSWFAPSSVTIFRAPTTTKEQAGQPITSQSTSKQVVVQTPPVQSQSQSITDSAPGVQANHHTSTTPLSEAVAGANWLAVSGETISKVQTTVTKQAGQSPAAKSGSSPKQSGPATDATPDVNSNTSAAQSTKVVAGVSCRAVSSGSNFQTPSTQVVTAAAISTSPASPHIVWSASTFSAPVASIPQPASANSSTASRTPDQFGEHAENHKVNGRQVEQSASVLQNYTLPTASVVPLPDQVTPSLAQKSAGQVIVQSSSYPAPETSSKTSNLEVSPVPQNVSQTHISESAPTTSTPERSVTLLQQASPAAQQDEPGSDQSAASIASSGTPNNNSDPSAITAGVTLPETLPLAVADTLPIVGSGSAVASNLPQKATSNTANSKSSDFTIESNTVTSKTKPDAGASDTPSSHSVQNSQTDPSQSAASTPRITDNGVSHLQTQTGVAPAVSHDAPAPRVSTGSPEASRASDQHEPRPSVDSESGAAVTSSGINTTKLMQTMNETEMRIGMSSSDFGDISIRTTVSNHQMLAQISLDHNELSQALSAHVASAQTKLGDEYGLHASIEINNLTSSNSGEPGASSQREKGTIPSSSQTNNDAVPAEEESVPSLGTIAAAGGEYRLDIRA